MSRTARVEAPNCLHHLIARFLNREFLMFGAEARAEYLRRVEASLTTTDTLPLGYALMSSHTHWACITGREPPSRLVQSLHGGFAAWLNHQLHRLGPAFGGRFTDVVCPEERTGVLLAYLHNNPVRAGVVDDPSDCDWTSHRAYLGLAAPPPWLNVKRGLALCGFDASQAGRAHFHDFVLSRAARGRDPLLTGDDESDSRRRVRALSGADSEAGGAVLTRDLQRAERDIIVVPGAVIRPRWPGSALEVVALAARQCGVALEDVRSRNRSRPVVEVRRLALWIWTRRLGRAQSEMNGVLGVSAAAGSQLMRGRLLIAHTTIEQLAEELWAPIRQGTATGTGDHPGGEPQPAA